MGVMAEGSGAFGISKRNRQRWQGEKLSQELQIIKPEAEWRDEDTPAKITSPLFFSFVWLVSWLGFGDRILFT